MLTPQRFTLSPLSISLFAALGLLSCSAVFAQETNDSIRFNEQIQELEVTKVEDSAKDDSSFMLGPGDMRSSMRNDLSEALSIVSSVQVDNTASSSLQQSDIQPAEFSIRGAAPYQNNIQLDNASIDSFLDPANKLRAGETPSRTEVSGHSQSIFIDPRFLSNIEIIDSNASAKEGGFIGGVVKAQTRGYEGRNTATVSHRLTGDSWTEFHVDEKQLDKFNDGADQRPTGTPGAFQPSFDKSETSISGATRFGNVGVFAGFSDKRSETIQRQAAILDFSYFLETGKLYRIGDPRKLESNSQYYTVRADLLEVDYDLYATLSYSTFFTDSFLVNYADSGFSSNIDGINFALNYGSNFDNTRMDVVFAVNVSDNERNTDVDFFSNYNGRSVFTDNALNGNFGSLKSNQQVVSTDFDFATKLANNVNFNYGLQMKHINAEQQRAVDFTDTDFYPNDQTLMQGSKGPVPFDEHHITRQVIYGAGDIGDSIFNATLYAELAARTERFYYRAGARIERDGLFNNINVAPRVSGGMFLNDEQDAKVELGLNRYYGKSFLSYILRDEEKKFVTVRERATNYDPTLPIIEVAAADQWLTSDLDSPYSDEVALKFALATDYGNLGVNLVKRTGYDEVRTDYNKPDDTFRYTNDGASQSRTADLKWLSNRYEWLNASWNVNASLALSKQKTDAEYVDGGYAQIRDSKEEVIFNGDTILRTELPAADFSRPVRANVDIVTSLFSNSLQLRNALSYSDGYEYIDEGRKDKDTGLRTFTNVDQGSTFTWDLSAEYQFFEGNHSPYVKVDVINVLDSGNVLRVEGGNTVFALGRQYWLEIGYRY